MVFRRIERPSAERAGIPPFGEASQPNGAHKMQRMPTSLRSKMIKCGSLKVTYLAFHDAVLSPVHGLQADTAQWSWGRGRGGRRCSGGGGSGGLVIIVRPRQVIKVTADASSVGRSNVQNLFLCISENEIHVCTLVPNLLDGFAKTHINQKPEYN